MFTSAIADLPGVAQFGSLNLKKLKIQNSQVKLFEADRKLNEKAKMVPAEVAEGSLGPVLDWPLDNPDRAVAVQKSLGLFSGKGGFFPLE